MRQSGISAVGAVPWGTHFCHFYTSAQDLVDVLVPFMQAGLEADECCLWVTSPPLPPEAAADALGRAVPNLASRVRAGQIAFHDASDWYLRGGAFDADAVLQAWSDRLREALAQGYAGLRAVGNMCGCDPDTWPAFKAYEQRAHEAIRESPMLVTCAYALDRCGPADVSDVIANHAFALVRWAGDWRVIENPRHRRTRMALETEFVRPVLRQGGLTPAAEMAPADADAPRIRILVVDDHDIVREGLVGLLDHAADIEVVGEAGSGQEAIDLARDLRPDVIVMDVSMPGMDGIEATRRITAECPGIRVVGLSMHDGDSVVRRMRDAGAAAYVTKGGPADDLLDAVRSVAQPEGDG